MQKRKKTLKIWACNLLRVKVASNVISTLRKYVHLLGHCDTMKTSDYRKYVNDILTLLLEV